MGTYKHHLPRDFPGSVFRFWWHRRASKRCFLSVIQHLSANSEVYEGVTPTSILNSRTEKCGSKIVSPSACQYIEWVKCFCFRYWKQSRLGVDSISIICLLYLVSNFLFTDGNKFFILTTMNTKNLSIFLCCLVDHCYRSPAPKLYPALQGAYLNVEGLWN